MINQYYRSLLLASALYLIGGCKRQTAEIMMPNAQISFYNASYFLSLMINGASGSNQAPILLDTLNPGYQPPRLGAGTQTVPSFNSRSSNGTTFQFPNQPGNAALSQPWVLYMRIARGSHSLLLADTGLVQPKPLLTTSFDAQTDTPKTIFFSDSLGVFTSVVSADDQQLPKDSIRVRVAHMSPDAGYISLLFNNQQHVVDSAVYGTVSAYKNYPLTGTSTISLKVRSSTDTTLELIRAALIASSGRSYTLVLQGYTNNGATFTGPDGNIITVNAALGLRVLTSH